MSDLVITQLYEILQERKSADPDQSYAAALYKKGTRKISQKLGEEAVELVIEAMRLDAKPKSGKARGRVVSESADLMFHFLALLAHHNIPPEEIFKELESRMGTGGLAEKASRLNK